MTEKTHLPQKNIQTILHYCIYRHKNESSYTYAQLTHHFMVYNSTYQVNLTISHTL